MELATGIFSFLDNLSLLGTKLSPEIIALIQEHDGARAQNILTRRMKRCVRHCKREKYGESEVDALVALDFQDLGLEKIAQISKLIWFQIKK